MIRPRPTGTGWTGATRDGPVQFKAANALSGRLFRPLLGGKHNHGRLIWSWQFEVGELAVKQLGLKEMTVPARQPLRRRLPVDSQERHLRGWPAVEQDLPVAPLQRGAG